MLKFAESKTCRRQVLLDALDAEQAACLGCDICKTQENLRKQKKKGIVFKAPDHTSAEDRNLVLKYFHRYSKSWNTEQALNFLQNKLNKRTLALFGVNVWETSDAADILNQLQSEQKIYVCRWPWKNKIAAVSKKQKLLFCRSFFTFRSRLRSV